MSTTKAAVLAAAWTTMTAGYPDQAAVTNALNITTWNVTWQGDPVTNFLAQLMVSLGSPRDADWKLVMTDAEAAAFYAYLDAKLKAVSDAFATAYTSIHVSYPSAP